jgi:molecular chaperone GrpE
VSQEQNRPSQDQPPSQPGEQAAPDAPAEAGAAEQASALAAERDEYKDRWMRQLAEVENYKKRAERERADFLRRANEGMVKDLLPVLDNLERAREYALENAQGEEHPLAQGVGLTHQELVKVLERHGLEKIEALGQPFNPEFHEAMLQQEDPDQEENTVLRELGRGYLFQGRLLRPAMVVVSKRPAAADDDGAEIKINIS